MTENKHDEIVESLLKVLEPLNGELRLFGRVCDPAIGNASNKEVFFFIPDLHLVSQARRHYFGKYGFNHEKKGVLVKLLQELARLRQVWRQDRKYKLVTMQLGDFFDVWREFASISGNKVPEESFGDLRDVLYRGQYRGVDCLKATMILGNHDTDLGEPFQGVDFMIKAFNRTENGKPFMFVTHGDAYSLLETVLPEVIKEIGVNFIGKLSPVHKYSLGDWGKFAARINKPIQDLRESIVAPEHLLETMMGAPKVLPGEPLPECFGELIEVPNETENSYFNKLYSSIEYAGQLGLSGRSVKVAVVGHTHKPAMIFCKPPNGARPMVLMDVGAWIEKCTYYLKEDDTNQVTEPNAQLGVIHGNDARIYQVRVPENP